VPQIIAIKNHLELPPNKLPSAAVHPDVICKFKLTEQKKRISCGSKLENGNAVHGNAAYVQYIFIIDSTHHLITS